MWKQHELWDGTYILTDLINIHEALEAEKINEDIAMEHYQRKAEKEINLRSRR